MLQSLTSVASQYHHSHSTAEAKKIFRPASRVELGYKSFADSALTHRATIDKLSKVNGPWSPEAMLLVLCTPAKGLLNTTTRFQLLSKNVSYRITPAVSKYDPNIHLHTLTIAFFWTSASHSNSDSLTPSHTLSHPLTPSHTLSHPLTPSHTLSHTLTQPLKHPEIPSHTPTHSNTLQHEECKYELMLSAYSTHTHSYSLILTHTHSHHRTPPVRLCEAM
jgi:hypothetical protein